MKILVLNSGSSSLKFQFVEEPGEVLARGLVERIGAGDSRLSCRFRSGEPVLESFPVPDHRTAIGAAFSCLTGRGVIRDLGEIEGVGHRMVHGGERFRESVVIDDEVERAIDACSVLAPLHNPPNLSGYRASREFLPAAPHVAVFDTAFHQTLPAHAANYAIPAELRRRYGIRRYGFHGTSHRYVSRRFAGLRGVPLISTKAITCHLGNGCSMCAIDGGVSVDTSMGFTPLEGLVMGTRPGDIDAGVLLQLACREGVTPAELEQILNRRSGLLGVSGVSNDMRDLLHERELGHEGARLAVAMFCYRIRKYIGSYLAALGGADAVIFTGGIGENAWQVREESCAGLEKLGLRIDPAANRGMLGAEGRISREGSAVEAWVIPTDEERLIAADTARCILGLPMD